MRWWCGGASVAKWLPDVKRLSVSYDLTKRKVQTLFSVRSVMRFIRILHLGTPFTRGTHGLKRRDVSAKVSLPVVLCHERLSSEFGSRLCGVSKSQP
jgi:hypothetical protein